MSKNSKTKVTITQLKNDALQARKEMIAEGGMVLPWRLPRIARPQGPNPVFSTPEELWDAAVAYFEWSESNPIEHETEVRVGNGVQIVKINKRRPFHFRAFKHIAGISTSMWRRLKELPEFEEVIEEIEDIIFTQTYDGGMTGIFDAGLTAKSLGISDKKEISGPNDGPLEIGSAKDMLIARLIQGKQEMK